MSDARPPVVSALWCYPVKSRGGRRVDHAVLTADGLAGDREWGVVDVSPGLTASAEHPARFGRPLDCAARLDGDGPPLITLPDGDEVRAGDPAADEALSRLLGRDVALRPADDAPHRISRTDPLEAAPRPFPPEHRPRAGRGPVRGGRVGRASAHRA